ncbi:MAG TPA: hypothetical protein VN258_03270 [Mobilitalea sp.]|nr:hypothetical protein [Mobilitalea sp.]
MLWTDYDVIEDLGIILGSEDVVTLDAYINSHLEPTIGSYDVEYLNDCIVRLIKLYYQ